MNDYLGKAVLLLAWGKLYDTYKESEGYYEKSF